MAHNRITHNSIYSHQVYLPYLYLLSLISEWSDYGVSKEWSSNPSTSSVLFFGFLFPALVNHSLQTKELYYREMGRGTFHTKSTSKSPEIRTPHPNIRLPTSRTRKSGLREFMTWPICESPDLSPWPSSVTLKKM